MPRLVATQQFPYAGRDLAVGEEFQAADEDARILKGVGKAEDAPKRGATRTRAMKPVEAAEEPKGEGDLLREDHAGRYHRTDMRAED